MNIQKYGNQQTSKLLLRKSSSTEMEKMNNGEENVK